MLKNIREVGDSRLIHLTDKDYAFFMEQTSLSRSEVERIFEIFNQKGGVLNRHQFKEAFEALTKNWLGGYKNIQEISDLVFSSFDKNHDAVLELDEFMIGCACLFLSKGDPRKKLEYIFDFYDVKHDGTLTVADIKDSYKALFKMLGSENSEVISKAMAEVTMQDITVSNKKNKITKEQFITLMLKEEKLLEHFKIIF